ncbi:translocation/assembly module TamB domain-containing protein [Bradyrhizobium sp. LHD-71]|uniref:translocation/assembly module TamB domain-containing protein n=1 Tax=Bradyrhizobium sp. LHD-71 TaxID=3072141 RepID=UPI00280E0988|nr:translocation/assembly module TamB domain-containing protein [Bradyrhizobium sp. LHD-71]MDQ8728415.1 translocation/assembly module TamB domain-containing protein [Bradyrhizobium sp. LHD-71]
MRISRPKRSRLRWLGYTAAALLILFAVVFAVLQTGPGKRQLASLAGTLASGDGLTVTVANIEGVIPTSMRVGAVTLADGEGEFARIEGLRFAWHPFALIRGTLAVETLEASKVFVARRPSLPAAPAADGADDRGTRLAMRLVLDRFAVGEIDIAEPLVGQAVQLGFTASARLMEPARGLSLSFALNRRDAEGSVKGTLGFVPETNTLEIDVQAAEPEGGLVAQLSQLDGLPAMQAEIKGRGPLDHWDGTINFTAGSAGSIGGTATIRRHEARHRVALGINADVQHLLPANLAPLFEGVSEVAAAALIDNEMRVAIETLSVRTTGFGAGVTGFVDRPAGTADLAFSITGGDAARFSTLLPGPSWSNLRLEGTLRGAFAAPTFDVRVAAAEFGAAGYGARGVDVHAVTVSDRKGGLACKVEGRVEGLTSALAALEGLLGGDVSLAGAVAYGADGAVAVDRLTLESSGLNLNVNGRVGHEASDLSARALVPDLGRVDPRLKGRAEVEAVFAGTLDALAVKGRLAVPQGSAMGQPVEGLALHVDARDLTRTPVATARLEGQVGGKPANAAANIAVNADGSRSLRDLDLAIGSVTARGGLNVSSEGLIDGRVGAAARNLADLSALALTELAGAGEANLVFTAKDNKQHVSVNAFADKVQAGGNVLDIARIDFSIDDATGRPRPNGKAEVSGLQAEGLRVDKLVLLANGTDNGGSDLKLDIHAQGAALAATARLTAGVDATELRLDSFRATKGGTRLALSAPATVTFTEGALAIDRLVLAAGSGSAVIRGKAGEAINLDMELRNLPLALAGLADPKLDLSGTLSGVARFSGPAAKLNGSYDLAVSRFSMPDLMRSGVGPLEVKAKGVLSSGQVGLDVRASGPSLSGVAVTGSVPMDAQAIDLNVKGSVALGIANAVLAASGARASGTAIIDLQVKGTVADPLPNGTVRISGARFDDTTNGVALDAIEGVITATGRSLTTSLTARPRNGGNIAVNGNVGIDPARSFPGKLEITLQNAGLVSSELMRLVVDGQLAISGPFASRPRLAGRFEVKSLDINIPDKLPGSAGMLDVRHMNGGPNQTAARTGTKKTAARDRKVAADTTFVADLDVAINASNNVFVRGMGMESELGGSLTLKGTSTAPVSVGSFEMRRGRFDVLGRRLDFTRGKVMFSGTLDPNLDFIAETKSADVTTKVMVSGLASQPQISFASSPELPQDEVLARLLFNKSAGSLTAGQAVQVAQTIAQFSGGGPGITENVRRSLGVDSLDVGTDGNGGQVGVAKRLNDRIYLGVRQGTSPGSSKATIDIDVTKSIRIQGATGADGGTETGVGMHWDY